MIGRSALRHWIRVACAGLVFVAAQAQAIESFTVRDIRVEGLQRIAAGTVFNYLPVKKGDRIDNSLSNDAIRALFKTGFFKDVVLEREGSTLVVFVVERPAIASIEVEGNVEIQKDPLMASLTKMGLAEGRVFDRSMLDQVEQELKRQYLALGNYAAKVKTEAEPLERNRVAIKISIAEGEKATIKRINIVGNKAVPESALLERFELGATPPISLFYSGDQYAKQKLAADLETMRSYYLDRGYVNFNIDSTQVAITPDKQHIYITINVTEGEQYRVSRINVSGDTIIPEQDVRKLISLESGQIFSRRELTESATRIGDRLGEVGYAFANVNPIPEVNDAKREVKLTYFVDPGKRIYVRRINIAGHERTNDEVLRREMRQMEGAPLESAKVNRSRIRLNRLGFFDTVNVDTRPVPGAPDLVDVNFDVKERDSFGTFNAGVGYGDINGLIFNVSVSEENFKGTGNRYTLNFNNSKAATEYSFSYSNPYSSLDGVSRSTNLFYRTTDPSQTSGTAGYTTDAYGAGVRWGVPISEYNTFSYGINGESTRVVLGTDPSDAIVDFCDKEAPGADCAFDTLKGNTSWSFDTRDRVIFPTDGRLQTLGAEAAIPAGGKTLSFYKLNYGFRDYSAFDKQGDYILQLKTDLAYADAYGETQDLPPFEKYRAGGTRTVRGFTYTLGPKDLDGNPKGGNVRVLGNVELLFRGPLSETNQSARFGLFLDAGNVFNEVGEVSTKSLRYSTGLTFYWFTPVGPLTFSYSVPLKKGNDKTEVFQFSLGTTL